MARSPFPSSRFKSKGTRHGLGEHDLNVCLARPLTRFIVALDGLDALPVDSRVTHDQLASDAAMPTLLPLSCLRHLLGEVLVADAQDGDDDGPGGAPPESSADGAGAAGAQRRRPPLAASRLRFFDPPSSSPSPWLSRARPLPVTAVRCCAAACARGVAAMASCRAPRG